MINSHRQELAPSGFPPRPDFAMCGVRDGDIYYVYASAQLSQAEIEAVVHQADRQLGTDIRLWDTRTEYRLKAVMLSLTFASGASYAEAFKNLFAAWSPDTQSPLGINSARGVAGELS